MKFELARKVADALSILDHYANQADILSTEFVDIQPPYTLRVEFNLYHEQKPEPIERVIFQASGDCLDARIQQAMIEAARAEMLTIRGELEAEIKSL